MTAVSSLRNPNEPSDRSPLFVHCWEGWAEVVNKFIARSCHLDGITESGPRVFLMILPGLFLIKFILKRTSLSQDGPVQKIVGYNSKIRQVPSSKLYRES